MQNTKYLFFDNLKRFFTLNKTIIIFICSFIILGFITGVFTTLKLGQEFSLNLLQNIALKKFLLNDCGFFGFLFLSLLFCFVYIVVSFFLSYFKIGKIFLILFYIYLAYLVGIDFIIIIKCLGSIKGFLFALFGYLIWRFLFLFLLFLFALKLSYYNKQLCCYGRCSISDVSKKLFLTFLTTGCIVIFIQSLILLILLKIFVFV